ncbi:hypothetical protein CMQ_505 [Grosmannia clavigera kw1407]|uniref:Phosphatidylinositol N-acetylglucosaminyltransferase subunit H conserved domain-containing protein n=1 Tax=Grosmannia clavigera (strain kw1407 / UAMH 11150) TaxID=655863 RepID=F0XDE4_GROCL|nr:uncharacterized protein CMQ_505 [Grosmannia clavigera kw1407]EFX03577.1 hypothetical protein CMQ_505 [Grosmannia clavigera kw1407]
MAFSTPHLEIRRPSPTTVEFTVTTQPRRTGWTGWAMCVAVVVLRLLLAAGVAVAVWGWGRSQPCLGGRGGLTTTTTTTTKHSVDALVGLLAAAAASTPAWLLLPLCAVAAWASVARVHTSESLLVLRGLGIQTRSTGATYVGELASALGLAWWTLTSPWALLQAVVAAGGSGGSAGWMNGLTEHAPWAASLGGDDYEPSPAAATRFIPTAKLQDLLVNEAFLGFEVRYYLVAVVGGTAGTMGWCADGSGGGGGADGDGEHYADSAAPSSQNRSKMGDNADRRGGDRAQTADGDDEDHVVVVFPQLLPGLDIVRTVWREARVCLYEPDGQKS